jgi:hypothetical protein
MKAERCRIDVVCGVCRQRIPAGEVVVRILIHNTPRRCHPACYERSRRERLNRWPERR